MRDYSKVSPSFWTGETGKALRRRGIEGAYVACYLMTAPGSSMLGLYYQPLLYMAHETGLGIDGASKGLRDAIESGFCAYDSATEMVWVFEMARYQIGDALKSGDKRCVGIQREYASLPTNPFLGPFFDRYAEAFHLTERRGDPEAPSDAPSMPHRCQEQEQEHEQEQEQEHEQEQEKPPGVLTHTAPPNAPKARRGSSSKPAAAPEIVDRAVLIAAGFAPTVADDFIAHKAKVKAPLTVRAWADHCAEAKKAGWTVQRAAEKVMARSWKGFEARYVAERGGGNGAARAFDEEHESRLRESNKTRNAAAKRLLFGDDATTTEKKP